MPHEAYRTLLHSLTSTAAALLVRMRVSRKDSIHLGKSVPMRTGGACSRKDSKDKKQQWQDVAVLGTELAGFGTSERKHCTATRLSGAKRAKMLGSPNSSQGRMGSMVSLH